MKTKHTQKEVLDSLQSRPNFQFELQKKVKEFQNITQELVGTGFYMDDDDHNDVDWFRLGQMVDPIDDLIKLDQIENPNEAFQFIMDSVFLTSEWSSFLAHSLIEVIIERSNE